MANPEVYKNYIGGRWTESRIGETFENRNPANIDEVVGIFQKSSSEDVNDAVAAVSARALAGVEGAARSAT